MNKGPTVETNCSNWGLNVLQLDLFKQVVGGINQTRGRGGGLLF